MTRQQDILDWFIKQRVQGNHDFFSRSFVVKCLDDEGFNNNTNTKTLILKLHNFGFLDVWKSSEFKLRFRAVDRIIKDYFMED